eukprot:5435151-Ditylum_brightwellii.AAC.1
MDNPDRGDYMHLVDDRVGMPGATTVTRYLGQEYIDVACPNDIVLYQQHVGGVDRGDQHCVTGAGFSNISHYKKGYTKVFFGIADFSCLNAFIVWNLSVNLLQKKQRGGELNRYQVLKWDFYISVAEEMMTCMDGVDNNDNNTCMNSGFLHSHSTAPIPQDYDIKRPHCVICSMEESLMHMVQKIKSKCGRSFARHRAHLVRCSMP